MSPILRRQWLASAAGLLLPRWAAPAAQAVLPSPRQLAWHKLETYAFLHFTLNTFTDKEWGYGDEDPKLFHPEQFDAARIVAELKEGGMRAVILTCKHHDGFCLWPTKTTKHNISASPFRGGKGDVVKELSTAARQAGLGFGVYLSPWDRNHPTYGTPEYVQVYRQQLTELLTNYGEIFEVWHDGANGGDGYYGGAREKRAIDRRTYYDWPGTWELVRRLQPKAVIFSDVGPDLRWVGNEKGFANETCWATYSPHAPEGGVAAPGYVLDKEGGTGHRDGKFWMPAECDVSIRPGWFYHASQDNQVKTPAQLFDLYCKSVGRGASFLLNVPPDRRGLLHANDVASLKEFGRKLRETFARNHLGKPKASGASANGASFTAKLSQPANLLRLREELTQGQRIDAFVVEQQEGAAWTKVAEGTSVGACRLLPLGAPLRPGRLRLRITQSSAPVRLAEFSAYQMA